MGYKIPTENGAGVIAGQGKPYRIKIRRGDDWEVKNYAEQLDGLVFVFREGWKITEEDSTIYVDEMAMIPNDFDWPADAPSWIAMGDLQEIGPACAGCGRVLPIEMIKEDAGEGLGEREVAKCGPCYYCLKKDIFTMAQNTFLDKSLAEKYDHCLKLYLKAINELLDAGLIRKIYDPAPGTMYFMAYTTDFRCFTNCEELLISGQEYIISTEFMSDLSEPKLYTYYDEQAVENHIDPNCSFKTIPQFHSKEKGWLVVPDNKMIWVTIK